LKKNSRKSDRRAAMKDQNDINIYLRLIELRNTVINRYVNLVFGLIAVFGYMYTNLKNDMGTVYSLLMTILASFLIVGLIARKDLNTINKSVKGPLNIANIKELENDLFSWLFVFSTIVMGSVIIFVISLTVIYTFFKDNIIIITLFIFLIIQIILFICYYFMVMKVLERLDIKEKRKNIYSTSLNTKKDTRDKWFGRDI
jgi:heme/copper-type cytochrome/quinol oxidase subunit 4